MHHRPVIAFCPACAAPVTQRLPSDGDTRERAICTACHTVHYQNPLNVVGTLPVWQGQVLLCKRNIEPRKGLWTLPAGFMELGESTAQGAARETREEAGAEFELHGLISVISVPRVGQVHLYHLARLTSPVFAPGHETQEARLFAQADVPWDDLAFGTVRETLRCYFEDRAQGLLGPDADGSGVARLHTHVLTLD